MEERQQAVVGPAQLVGFQYAVAVLVEVVGGVGKGDLLHLIHVGANYSPIGCLHDHGGGLLRPE